MEWPGSARPGVSAAVPRVWAGCRLLRLRRARGLLASGIPPAAAAAEAGFAGQAHLTRWFRRYYGVTPGAYQWATASR